LNLTGDLRIARFARFYELARSLTSALGGDIDPREVRVTSKAFPFFSTLCRCAQSRGGAIECTAGSLDTNRPR
jgi:hypothetical protein